MKMTANPLDPLFWLNIGKWLRQMLGLEPTPEEKANIMLAIIAVALGVFALWYFFIRSG